MKIRPNIIVPLVPYAATYLQTGGALIVSGILEEEGPELLHKLRTLEFIAHEQVIEDGWVAYVLSQVL
jgi:ribosomal protein L11 methylase PrmA